MSVLIKLKYLRPGQTFALPDGGRKGMLLYANDCRARVRLGATKVEIKGKEFSVSNESDWAPDTEVIPTKLKGGKNGKTQDGILPFNRHGLRNKETPIDNEADAIFKERPEE